MRDKLRLFCAAVLLAGVVLLLVGLNFILVKAGIPYQDPTPEMTLRWTAYFQAGTITLRWAIGLLAAGGLGRVLTHLIGKRG